MSSARVRVFGLIAGATALAGVVAALPANAKGGGGNGNGPLTSTTTTAAGATNTSTSTSTTSTTVSGPPSTTFTFTNGILDASAVGSTGCGTDGNANVAGEPAIAIAPNDDVIVGSERGLGGGSDAWYADAATGGAGASACSLTYAGQPNAVAGVGTSGGDISVAQNLISDGTGHYVTYLASLNLGSVAVARSTDGGRTYSNVPVQGGLPVDDREWIAAAREGSVVLTFHGPAGNIEVLRSNDIGDTYTEISEAIAPTDPNATNNELGNVAIDRRNDVGIAPGPTGQTGFWTYQPYAAPAPANALVGTYNGLYLAVSNDGGYTWTSHVTPCQSSNGFDHMFPNVSVAPNGTVWMAASDDTDVYVTSSSDHGATWSPCTKISTTTGQAMMPWLAAGAYGVDLVYYGSPSTPGPNLDQTWYVYVAQLTATGSWATPVQTVAVHQGPVCEGGASCATGRQLFDDFGLALDHTGHAHIAYSHDAPTLGGSGTYTGYLVQTGGSTIGWSN